MTNQNALQEALIPHLGTEVYQKMRGDVNKRAQENGQLTTESIIWNRRWQPMPGQAGSFTSKAFPKVQKEGQGKRKKRYSINQLNSLLYVLILLNVDFR